MWGVLTPGCPKSLLNLHLRLHLLGAKFEEWEPLPGQSCHICTDVAQLKSFTVCVLFILELSVSLCNWLIFFIWAPCKKPFLNEFSFILVRIHAFLLVPNNFWDSPVFTYFYSSLVVHFTQKSGSTSHKSLHRQINEFCIFNMQYEKNVWRNNTKGKLWKLPTYD